MSVEPSRVHTLSNAVGWTSSHTQAGYHQTYDPYANMNMQQREEIGMKGKLVNLIGAVRTLMRGALPFARCIVTLT